MAGKGSQTDLNLKPGNIYFDFIYVVGYSPAFAIFKSRNGHCLECLF